MNDSQLPALLPTAALVLQRTQITLGLTRDVVQESSAEYWCEHGRAAEAEGQWVKAAYAYRQCVERDPDHWRGAVRRAAALGHLGQAEAAAEALTEASEAAVEDWHALVAELAEPTWYQLRDSLETALKAVQDGFELSLGLALVYRALKQGEQARQMLDMMQFTYQQQVAESAQWFWLSGNLYSDKGIDFSHESIAEYTRAIELQLDYLSAYFCRGLKKGCLSVRDYDGAISDYNRVIDLKPNCASAYCNRGLAKYDLLATWDPNEDYTGAIADFDRAIELEPGYASAYCNRGIAKNNLKDYTGAIADFDRAVELKNNESYYHRAGAKYSLKNYTGALADYDCAIELEPNYVFAYFYRGLVKDDLQDYAGAVADYNQTIALGLNDWFIYKYRAYAKERIGNAAGAEADRKLALAIQLMDSNESS